MIIYNRKNPQEKVNKNLTLQWLLGMCTVSVIIIVIFFFMKKDTKLTSCSKVTVTNVWTATIPKLMTESAVRLIDVNKDSIDDVIIGFSTGIDAAFVPRVMCDMYFNGTAPCSGGVLALDGKNGRELWRRYTEHEIFALNCNEDLNGDATKDCLAGGRGAAFLAISGATGNVIWKFSDPEVKEPKSNLYTAQFLPDLNHDNVPDVINIHGGDPNNNPGETSKLKAKIIIFSGANGKVLRACNMPDGRQSYFSPVLLRNGEIYVLFGTGGETQPGGLYSISLHDLYAGKMEKAKLLYFNKYKGIMTPPVLADLNKNNIEDIIFADFNSSVVAIDGQNHAILWKYTLKGAETYSFPAKLYCLDLSKLKCFDKNYIQTTVIDGKSGKPLLKPFIVDSIGSQSSSLAINLEGAGNDLFTYWRANCRNHSAVKNRFDFASDVNVHERSRSDFCRGRFKTDGVTTFEALARKWPPGSIILYNSDKEYHLERAAAVDTANDVKQWLDHDPSGLRHKQYNVWQELLQSWKQKHSDVTNASTGPAPNKEDKELKFLLFDSVTKMERNSTVSHRTERKRVRRHIGSHDDGGIQRLISTGTLASSLSAVLSKQDSSIDIIFATYWFYASKAQILLPDDQKCIDAKLKEEKVRFETTSKYFGMDEDAFRHAITNECLKQSGHLPPKGTFRAQADFDPYKAPMGQLTIYRRRLTCHCEGSQKCAKILPHSKQRWGAYMGSYGNSHFLSKPWL